MSSEQYLVATVVNENIIPFNIDEEHWAELSDNKRQWWDKIYNAFNNVNSKYKIYHQYSSFSNCIYFYFRSKNKVYKNLLSSLKTYTNKVFEQRYSDEYRIKVFI